MGSEILKNTLFVARRRSFKLLAITYQEQKLVPEHTAEFMSSVRLDK